MSLSEITILIAIALILFGPEDLPDIARALGKIIYELRKATGDITKEFRDVIETPVKTMEKTIKQSSESLSSTSDTTASAQVQTIHEKDEELLTYEAENKSENNPLANLPNDIVSLK